MTPLELVLSDEAISDLIDLWTYIAEDSPDRADQFIDQIVAETLQVVRVLSGYRDLDALF